MTANGQASVEWVAVVALVAAVLMVGSAGAQAGAVGHRVSRQLARALCVVSRGDCWRDREPCVVAARGSHQSVGMSLLFVRLGASATGVVEQRSDGTVAVTRAGGRTIGVEAGAGLSAKGLGMSVGVGVQASELLTREGGATWIVDSMAAADALLHRLRAGRPPPPPDISYDHDDLTSSLGGQAGADALLHLDLLHGELTFDRRAGSRVDHRTGHRTVYVRSAWNAGAEAAGRVLGRAAGVGEVYAVELDGAGRPLDLQIVTSGPLRGSGDLPDVVQPVGGLLAAGAGAADRSFEVTAHLDLTDAGNLAAAREVLSALATEHLSVGDGAAAAQALRRRLDERGTVEARVLAGRTSTRDVSVSGALGAKLGADVHVDAHTLRLLAATSRGLDGQWLTRDDCMQA